MEAAEAAVEEVVVIVACAAGWQQRRVVESVMSFFAPRQGAVVRESA